MSFHTASRGDTSRLQRAIKWFDCMATEEERTKLMDSTTDEGERRTIVAHLNDLCVCRLTHAFEGVSPEEQVKIPKLKKQGKNDRVSLKVTSIEDRVRQLKSLNVDIIVTRPQFALFRQEYEGEKDVEEHRDKRQHTNEHEHISAHAEPSASDNACNAIGATEMTGATTSASQRSFLAWFNNK